MVILGTIVLGLGISMTVIADVIMNSGEAFVKALSQVIKKEFGNVKIVFDVSCVVLAVGISLVLFDAKIVGTREGTIIAALLTGVVVKFFINKLNAPLGKLLGEQEIGKSIFKEEVLQNLFCSTLFLSRKLQYNR